MAVMFQYDRYQRLFGIRRLGMLENPLARPITRFCLPKGATVHYMPMTETEIGPRDTDPIIKAAQRLVYIDHVKDLLSKEGNPRPTYKLINPMMQMYRRSNMTIRPLRDYDAVAKDILNLAVINYAMVGQMYKYQRSALSRWWAWKNMRSTMWLKANSLRTEHERHQMIFLDVPDTLPALADLRKAERNMTPMLMRVFNTRERLDLLDIFIWLGEHREKSPMSKLDESRLDEFTLVIRRDTGFLTINLGLLNSWRKADMVVSNESLQDGWEDYIDFDKTYDEYVSLEALGDTTPVNDIDISMEAANGLDPKIMQIRFLKMLTKFIMQTNNVAAVADDQAIAEASELDDDTNSTTAIEEQRELEEENRQILESTGAIEELLADEEEELALELDAPATDTSEVLMTDEDGELIIEAADTREVEVQAVGVNGIVDDSLTGAITSKADELVDKQLYTGAQHRRMLRLAESYKTLKNPWGGEETIEQAMVITDADTVMTDADNYPEMEAVRDPSMLESTVEKMDRQYVEKVMKKDILNAVMSVQKAGIAVTGYDVEVVRDAVSHYEVHTVNLTPVTGKPSTIRFRVPVVDKKGVYISNGQRYRARTQKSDRKLSISCR